MAAGGIPRAAPGHLAKIAEAALQMLEEATQVRAPDGSKLTLRIGVHVGPVCAGVIGETKFIFDVWGDTVNMASRMESHGAPGRIQVTEAVRVALQDLYDFSRADDGGRQGQRTIANLVSMQTKIEHLRAVAARVRAPVQFVADPRSLDGYRFSSRF